MNLKKEDRNKRFVLIYSWFDVSFLQTIRFPIIMDQIFEGLLLIIYYLAACQLLLTRELQEPLHADFDETV